MEMEKRLDKLASQIALERSKGFIAAWSEKIKREAVYLTSVFGIKKVVTRTKLTSPSIYSWRKEFREETISTSDVTEEKVEVTRIVSNQVELSFKEELPIAAIIRDRVEFKIYCKEMAEKLVERFFL